MRASLLSLILFAAIACADEVQEEVRRDVAAGALLPLAAILARVQAEYPGQVLDVELEQRRDGRRLYEIELLTADGRRLELHVDAASGALIDRAGRDAGRLMPLPALLREVLQRHPGHIVDVDLDGARYHIEVARQGGDIVRVSADAVSGVLHEVVEPNEVLDDVLPLPDLLERIDTLRGGTVVEVELERDASGQLYYEIDVRGADGGAIELRIDARSGAPVAEGAR